MEDIAASLHPLAKRGGIRDVSLDARDTLVHQPVAIARRTYEGIDAVALREKRIHELRADEAAGARDEDLRRRKEHIVIHDVNMRKNSSRDNERARRRHPRQRIFPRRHCPVRLYERRRKDIRCVGG